MYMRVIKLLRTWGWTLVPAAVALAFGYTSVSGLTAQSPSPPGRRANAASFLPGNLDPSAVASAREFKDFPLVWLGEEFRGFKLTKFIRTNYRTPKEQTGYYRDISQNTVTLIYGDCIPQKTSDGPSCVPPLSIVIHAPNTVPGPQGVAPEVAGPVTSTRGLTSRIVNGSTQLWADNGISIQVHSNGDVRALALTGLQSANAGQVGLREIKAGESLAPLRNSAR